MALGRRSSRLAAAVIAVAAVSGVASAAKRPVTVDDLMAIRNVTDARVSPDGTRVVYVVSVPDLAANRHDSDLWLVNADGSGRRRLTAGPGRDDGPRWSPDGRRIAFLSDRDGSTRIWRIAPDGGEATAIDGSPRAAGPFAWFPDGRRLAVLLPEDAGDSDRRPSGPPVSVDAGREPPRMGIRILDVATGACVPLTRGTGSVESFSISPDGSEVAYSARPTSSVPDLFNSDLFVVDVASGGVRNLVVRPGPDSGPQWSPDGSRIAFVTTHGRLEWVANWSIGLVPAAGGPVENVTPDFDEFITSCRWAADGGRLFFTSSAGVANQLFAADVRTKTVAAVSSGLRVIADASFSRDGRVAAFTVSDSTHPADAFISRTSPFEPRRLAETNPQLAELDLGETEVVRWTSFDGREIEGLLLKPAGYVPGRTYPLLTYVHGGPSAKFECAFSPQIGGSTPIQGESLPLQALAGRGFAILMPNPRGSYGYGERFRTANVKDWGHGDYLDIMAGVDAMVARGVADPDRCGIMGRSYGGYMTAWAITRTTRFRAAALGAGMSNLVSFYGQTDIPGYMEYYLGGTPWTAREEYEARSPVVFADRVRTPVLITHGEEDARVPLPQARELYTALRRQGVEARLVVFPRQGHVVLEPRSEREIMALNLEWFVSHIPAR